MIVYQTTKVQLTHYKKNKNYMKHLIYQMKIYIQEKIDKQ